MGIFSDLRNKAASFLLGDQTSVENTNSVEKLADPIKKETSNAKPTQGGRVSSPEGNTIYSMIEGGKTLVQSETTKEVLDMILHLCKWNADMAYAVENIITLGNTEEEVIVDGLSEEQLKKLLPELRRSIKNWYEGGLTSLRGDLLAQVAIYGCISAEAVPMESLKGLKKVVLVNPRNIEFGYDKEKDRYEAYQRVDTGLTVVNNMVKLNPLTYKYFATRRFSEKPYAVPPFLSALESVALEKDMMKGFKNVVKRIGMMGFLEALVTAPPQDTANNESDESYQNRLIHYLTTYITPELNKGVAEGVVVGFKDTHEFKVNGNDFNISGAKDFFNLITEIKMGGLKQDPRMLGRQFSTTETYGAVILKKFSEQIATYQMVVDEFIAHCYYLELLMLGYNVKYVEVRSQRPMLADELNEQNALAKKIENMDALYTQGIISQQQKAVALGYDKPDSEEPRTQAPIIPPVSTTDPAKPQAAKNSADVQEAIAALQLDGDDYYEEEYDYGDHTNCNCQHHDTLLLSGQTPVDELETFVSEYFGAVRVGYKKAIKSVTKDIGLALSKLGEGVTEQQVSDSILYALYTNWDVKFTRRQEKLILQWVSKIHKTFRSNVGALSKLPTFDPANPPKAVFGLLDTRAIEYYRKSDTMYLGKFITDDSTRNKMTQFIKEQYLGKNLPIGKDINSAGMKLFRDQFGEVLVGEEWKIARIINTTVNSMRNNAAVQYMKDSSAVKYEVRGVTDRLQCEWCKSLQGKQFNVEVAISQMEELYSTSPSEVKLVKPFITSEYSAKDLKDLTQEALDKMGLVVPLHANCRDVVIAVI